MKIILSRKGFDSSYGGVPSPILPDGTLLSLPIPVMHGRLLYGNLRHQPPFEKIVNDLAGRNFTKTHFVHLDPDIRPSLLPPRPPGWRPLFGQVRAARGHLIRQEVKENALFLFFGWFRRVGLADGRYYYLKDAPDIHLLFGWMQVEKPRDLNDRVRLPNWARNFPHFDDREGTIVYAARRTLHVKGLRRSLPGAGVFEKYSNELQLTEHGKSRSIWRLPRWFFPFDPKRPRKPLTYHADKNRWEIQNSHVLLHAAARGQEFVFDTADYPEAYSWVKALFEA